MEQNPNKIIICCSWIFSVALEYYLLLWNIFLCSWILSVALEYYPFLLNIIRCSWILSVVLEYYPLFLNIIRCSWILSVVFEYFPLFLIIIRCSWILSVVQKLIKRGYFFTRWRYQVLLTHPRFQEAKWKFLIVISPDIMFCFRICTILKTLLTFSLSKH